eukprot:m51a1_g6373 hypothetical protein (696) ;mRNA; f:131948-134394
MEHPDTCTAQHAALAAETERTSSSPPLPASHDVGSWIAGVQDLFRRTGSLAGQSLTKLSAASSSMWAGFKGHFVSPDTEFAVKQVWMLLVQYQQDIGPLDMAAGLILLSSHYERHPLPPRLVGARALTPQDGPYLEEACAVLRHACAVFGWKLLNGFVAHLIEEDTAPPASTLAPLFKPSERVNMEALLRHTGMGAADVLDVCWVSEPFSPGHYVAVDRALGAAVVAFRGTWGLHDSLTDLVATPEQFSFGGVTGWTHRGIYTCAVRKAELLLAPGGPVEKAVGMSSDGRTLFVTGHSLGGGCATLFALIAARRRPDWHVRCWAFSPAATLSFELATSPAVNAVVRSFLYRDDLVPRLSIGSLGLLKLTVKKLMQQSEASLCSTSSDVARTASSSPLPPPEDQAQPLQSPRKNSAGVVSKAKRAAHLVAASRLFGEAVSRFIEQRTGPSDCIDVPAAIAAARAEIVGMSPDNSFLFPGGRVVVLRADLSPLLQQASRISSTSPVDVEAHAATAVPPAREKAKPVRYDADFVEHVTLSEIVLSSNMFLDHMPHKLELSMDSVASQLTGKPRRLASTLENATSAAERQKYAEFQQFSDKDGKDGSENQQVVSPRRNSSEQLSPRSSQETPFFDKFASVFRGMWNSEPSDKSETELLVVHDEAKQAAAVAPAAEPAQAATTKSRNGRSLMDDLDFAAH